MKITVQFCLLTLVIAQALGFCQAERDNMPIKATLCELAKNPEQYIGKMVEVKASVAGNDLWIDDFENKSTCGCWMGVIVVLTEKTKPNPDFDTVKDESFKRLFEDLRAGMDVQATFEGRFEAIYTWQNQKQICLSNAGKQQKGFGNKGQYGGRIILHRVSDIVSRRRPRL
jgi:hypothetical protein